MENIEVVLPYLVGGETKWFVEYRCFHPMNGLIQRFRIYKGFENKSEPEDLDPAERLNNHYTRKHNSGCKVTG
jgi:hypothetical protein